MVGTNRTFDFDAMSVDDLWQLYEKLSRVLSIRLTSEKRELEKRLAQLRREKELRVSETAEINAAPRERRKYPRVFPKYQRSERTIENLVGTRQAATLADGGLKTGHTIDEFVIRNVEADRTPSHRRRA